MCPSLGACAVPCFCSQIFRSDNWVFFGLFVSICPELSLNEACAQLFLAPYNFIVSFYLRRGVSRYKLCSTAARVPGPSLYRDRVGVSTYEFGGHKHSVCNKCGFYLSHSSCSWSECPILTQLSALAPPVLTSCHSLGSMFLLPTPVRLKDSVYEQQSK